MKTTVTRLLSVLLLTASTLAAAAPLRPLINPQPLPPGSDRHGTIGHGAQPYIGETEKRH